MSWDLALLLLDRGATPALCARWSGGGQFSPLYHAAVHRGAEVVEALVRAGATTGQGDWNPLEEEGLAPEVRTILENPVAGEIKV